MPPPLSAAPPSPSLQPFEPTVPPQDTDALRASLLKTHPNHPICGPDTEIVIEGYPRSSNTFTVDMIQLLMEGHGPHRRIAHHTHSVTNVELGLAFGVPTVVLVRRPEDAIVSYLVYSGRPVNACVSVYQDFYAPLAGRTGYIVGAFEEIVGDFNAFLARLNRLIAPPIPLSQDLAADAAIAHQRDRDRAPKVHGEHALRRVGVPDSRRDPLKDEVRHAVREALRTNPEPDRLYAAMMAKL